LDAKLYMLAAAGTRDITRHSGLNSSLELQAQSRFVTRLGSVFVRCSIEVTCAGREKEVHDGY